MVISDGLRVSYRPPPPAATLGRCVLCVDYRNGEDAHQHTHKHPRAPVAQPNTTLLRRDRAEQMMMMFMMSTVYVRVYFYLFIYIREYVCICAARVRLPAKCELTSVCLLHAVKMTPFWGAET